jgi:hypothetical protein
MMRDKNAGQLLLLNSEAAMFAKQYDGNPARKYVAKQRYKRDVESRPRHARPTRGVKWLVFRLRRNGKLGRRTRGRVWLYKWLCGESGLYHTGVTRRTALFQYRGVVMLSVKLSAFNPGGVGTKLRFSFGSYVLQRLGNALRGQISTAKISIFSAMYNVQDK